VARHGIGAPASAQLRYFHLRTLHNKVSDALIVKQQKDNLKICSAAIIAAAL